MHLIGAQLDQVGDILREENIFFTKIFYLMQADLQVEAAMERFTFTTRKTTLSMIGKEIKILTCTTKALLKIYSFHLLKNTA